jgi:hypothetical protein
MRLSSPATYTERRRRKGRHDLQDRDLVLLEISNMVALPSFGEITLDISDSSTETSGYNVYEVVV